MYNPRDSLFRNALKVSPERIALLSEVELNQLMGRLFLAQAYRCNSPLSDVRVNTEISASDDGCDGWTAKPVNSDEWFGITNTCWQFKAGSAGEPAQLNSEVTKRIPRDTLFAGGRFVVIASGSKSGKKGEEARLKTLITEAEAAGIPTTNITVIGSERLTNWCNQHPAIAAYWAGRPDGLWTLDDWLYSDEHQVPWQSSEPVQLEINDQRAKLDFMTGDIYHLHIQGQPGVGKTRFALELCRNADWRSTVVYIRDAGDIRLLELIDSAINDKGVQLIIVADEVQPEQLRPLRDSIGRGNGHVRIITIGHCPTPDPSRIPAFPISPLDYKAMSEVVKGWHPVMPLEHVHFVVHFADGYVRLAKLAADAVARNPRMNVRELLSHGEIRGFLDRMLGTEDRRSLYVVAVLTSVGWTDDKDEEGKAIAKHFGLDWNDVRYKVNEFNNRLGIVPPGGRYRYISPSPLGIRLAVEAWDIYPEQLRSLPDILPSDKARDAYYTRLQSMASNPRAQEFAREELNNFFRLDDFLDHSGVRRWSALAAADPDSAARNILRALISTSVEDRNRILGEARRQIIWTLVRLAWRLSSFDKAVKTLALLAEAENEKWANNATSQFVNRFQIILGGTSTPYMQRLSVLDELIADDRPTLTKLVIKALSKVGNRDSWRMESGQISDEVPEREWHPASDEEYFDCVVKATGRLISIANKGVPELQDDLITSADSLSTFLREAIVRKLVADLFLTINKAYPQSRERLRRIVADELKREDAIKQDDELRQKIGYWNLLTNEDLAEIKALHAQLEDISLESRLLQYVGVPAWDPNELPDLTTIAEELSSDPDLFAQHWPWLTSGEAQSGWFLGEALAKVDSGGKLAEIMPSFPGRGPDLRLLCGYMQIKRNESGNDWYDRWIDTQIKNDLEPETLIFEVIWRCGATEFIAEKLAHILRNKNINPQLVGPLTYGRWSENLSADVLENVLNAMYDTGHHETAIGILYDRMRAHKGEVSKWDALALKLVTSPQLIRSNRRNSYQWQGIATMLVPIHAGEIASAIISGHGEHRRTGWFLEFSDAGPVLGACTIHSPNEVWKVIEPYLSTEAYGFSLGFPRGILDLLPFEEIKAWVAVQPEERASLVSRLVSINISDDETLTSQIIGKYGDNDRVAEAFLSNYTSGSWSGPSSIHWDQLADGLETVVGRTKLPKLREWIASSANHLRQMAQHDRQREDEENLRDF